MGSRKRGENRTGQERIGRVRDKGAWIEYAVRATDDWNIWLGGPSGTCARQRRLRNGPSSRIN